MDKKRFSFFMAAAMAFIVSFGGAACIVTGFSMIGEGFSGLDAMVPANLKTIGILCGALALAASGYFRLANRRKYLWMIAALALVLYLWHRDSLHGAIEAILFRITSVYDLGYHWGVLQWTGGDPGGVSPDFGLFLLVAIPGIMAAWAVHCGKNSFLAVLLGSLPLAACLVVTDTVPDNWCLMLILTGLLVLILSASVRKKDAHSANCLASLLLIPVLLFQNILFWAIPRENYEAQMNRFQQSVLSLFQELPFVQMGADGNLNLQFNGSVSDSVNLSAVGPKWEMTFPVMEVTAPRDGVLYLRGQSLEAYDGTSWRSVASSGKDGWPNRYLKEVGTVTVETRSGHELLYFPYYPGGELWTENTNFDQGRLHNLKWERTYSFQQMELTQAGYVMLSDPLRKECLQLPEETLQKAKEYLKELPINAATATAEAMAEAVADFVKSTATYDLDTPRMPTGENDFAMWFLESSDTGYCVHFASAATVLMRAAGIPARYVSGYVLTASAGNAVTVRAGQAHAWVEYFDPLWGWRILEVTPAAQESETPTTEATETEPTAPETTGAEQTTPTTRPEEYTQPSVTAPSNSDESPKPERKIRIPWAAVNALVGEVVAAALIAGQYILRRQLRLRKMSTGNVNRRALEQWREIVRLCRILKWAPPKPLLELAEKAKFSQHTLTAEERKKFRLFIDKAETALAQKPFLLRSLIRLIWAVG